ncbi:PaaI family thioesterase [Mumia sp. DW29H23]|uniref:PaaI family thioesterase n=1 Tax=Mumia sp. DW29H23 TaxID=3421241 RepID=UPI003D698F88
MTELENRVDLLSGHWREWADGAARVKPDGWEELVAGLGALQDAVAGTVPPADVVAEASELMARVRDLLAPYEVAGSEQIFGRLLGLPSRGQTFSPTLQIHDFRDDELVATTRFGRFHSGNNGVVHGGAIAVMFDDALGRTADIAGGGRSRTASLTVDFRSLTQLDRDLEVKVRVARVDGRKRTLHGTLSDGERLCAEATGLFLEMRPEQA